MAPQFTEQYRTADKSSWERGPWDDEPDKVVWVDEHTGLDCMAVRNHHGAWCGYVGVPEGHPWSGQDYSEHEDIDVHGGLTYSNPCRDSEWPEHAICHQAVEGRPEPVWWFGFDCGHFMDHAPAFAMRMRELGKDHPELNAAMDASDTLQAQYFTEQYRDLDYVVAEVTNLAEQLAAVPVGRDLDE